MRARVFRSLYYHLGYVHSAPFDFMTAWEIERQFVHTQLTNQAEF